jgi:hypothetical protein
VAGQSSPRDTGYDDQSRVTAEFGAMMGVSPGAFIDGRLPPLATH